MKNWTLSEVSPSDRKLANEPMTSVSAQPDYQGMDSAVSMKTL